MDSADDKDATGSDESESGMEEEEEEAAEPGEGWEDILGTKQLYKKVVRAAAEDDDPKPQSGDVVRLRLKGTVDRSGDVVDDHPSLTLTLGHHEVVHGVEMGVQLMQLGEVALLRVAPRFAYGTLGLAPGVLGDDWITYELEVFSISTPPDVAQLSLSELRQMCEKMKTRGNFFYGRSEFEPAMQVYQKILSTLDGARAGLSSSESASLDVEEAVYANNLAAAALKVEEWELAFSAAERSLALNPGNEKATFRKAKALGGGGDAAGAARLLSAAVRAHPDSVLMARELSRLRGVLGSEAKAERRLYSRMIRGPKAPRSLPLRVLSAVARPAGYVLLVSVFALLLALALHLYPHLLPV